jgi:hypothetical protein
MDIIEEIKKLKSLFDQGAITQEEFNSLKSNLLSKVDNHTGFGNNGRNEAEKPNNIKTQITQTPIPQKTVFQQNQPISKNGSSRKYLLFLAIVVVFFVVIGISVSNSSSDSFSGLVETTLNENTSGEPASNEITSNEAYSDDIPSGETVSDETLTTNTLLVFRKESDVRQYMEGKTFYSNDDGVKISYGYISSANTYGITIENANGTPFYYINCSIRAYGSFCDISGMSPENGENFSFRAFKDNLVVGYGQAQSRTFYLQ